MGAAASIPLSEDDGLVKAKKKKKKTKDKSTRSGLRKKKKKKKKKKSTETVLTKEQALTLRSVRDPWNDRKSAFGGRMTPDEEWEVLMESDERNRGVHANLNIAQSGRGTSGTTIVIDRNALTSMEAYDADRLSFAEYYEKGDKSREADEKKFLLTSEIVERLVHIDCSASAVTSIAFVPTSESSFRCWARSVVASRNRITGQSLSSALRTMPKLLRLDLSENDLDGTLEPGTFRGATNIMWLSMRSCKLRTDSLEALRSLPSATHLDLGGNLIDHVDKTIDALCVLKKMTWLNLSGNPLLLGAARDEDTLVCLLHTSLPRLRVYNGEVVEETKKTWNDPPKGAQRLAGTTLGGIVAICGQTESCSCVEGNPCVSKYNCKDWGNRFEIAREARERKGRV
eukprot:g4570.t1